MEDAFQGMVNVRAPLQRLGERRRADRHRHELLHVHVGVGVLAAVHDVHHRHRKLPGGRAADVAVQGQAQAARGGLGDGQRDAQNRVRAQLALVVRAVQVDHQLINGDLLGGVQVNEFRRDALVDVLDRLQDALAAVDLLVAVAQLDRLVRARGRARRDARAAQGAVFQIDVHLDGGVAARVQNLPRLNIRDCRRHSGSCFSFVCRLPAVAVAPFVYRFQCILPVSACV